LVVKLGDANMMGNDSSTLPVPIGAEARDSAPARVPTIAQLAEIPEEDIWLTKQKSARTRRAYRLDMAHFMRMLHIASLDELRQADHRRRAWPRSRLLGALDARHFHHHGARKRRATGGRAKSRRPS
jgi:hypothetical protein